eukprot:12931017-Prorocentrum_lima.AAC.1
MRNSLLSFSLGRGGCWCPLLDPFICICGIACAQDDGYGENEDAEAKWTDMDRAINRAMRSTE